MAQAKAATSVRRGPETRNTRTKPLLFEALLSLLSERSFESITVRDITDRADLGYATFFRHYPDKESLLNDIAADQMRALLTMTTPLLYTVDSRASSQALCAYVWEHRKLWSVLLTGGAANILKAEMLRDAWSMAAENKSLDDWAPSELRAAVPTAGVMEILSWWLRQKTPPPPSRVAELIDELVVTPSWKMRNRKKS